MCFKYVNDNEKIFGWFTSLSYSLSLFIFPSYTLAFSHIRYSLFVYTKSKHEKLFSLFVYLLWFVLLLLLLLLLFIYLFSRLHGPHHSQTYSIACSNFSPFPWTMFNSNSTINYYYYICTRFVLPNLSVLLFIHRFFVVVLFPQCLLFLIFFLFHSHISVHMHT